MDTPAYLPPPNDSEQLILEKLTLIRDKLLLLKQDRTTYIRSQDVIPLYDETVEQVRLLHDIRQGIRSTEESQLDRVLESCFQLISLLFMTIGRNNEAPAAYSLTSTIRRLLDHIEESDLYSAKDLESLDYTINKIEKTIRNSPEGSQNPYMMVLLEKRIKRCRTTLDNLHKPLAELSEGLLSTHDQLICILRSLLQSSCRSKFSSTEVKRLQAQLLDISKERVDGQFRNSDNSTTAGSEKLSRFLDDLIQWAEIVEERKGSISESFKSKYDKLLGVRNELEKLSLTQAWSLRETDLYDYQRVLDRVDEQRSDGTWLDEQGNPADLYTKRILLYLLRKSYVYIYSLMISSEPVSEALLPIYNQLQTLKRCLIEVKDSGGVTSYRELYPYSMKLNSIDSLRVDGKFMVANDIPEGQGSVSELLAECFELNDELKIAVETQMSEASASA